MSKNKKLSPFAIIMKDDFTTESYRVSEKVFRQIKNKLTPFRSVAHFPKPVKCVETGEIFESAHRAKCWLIKNGVTVSPFADTGIKRACKGQRKSSCGYHWQFVENKPQCK